MLASWFRSLTARRRIAVPVHIPARKSGIASRPMESLQSTLVDAGELLVPLAYRPGTAVEPAVRPGDQVAVHDVLAHGDDRTSLPVFSPAGAVVEEITRVDTAHACDLPAMRLRLVPTASHGHSTIPCSHDVSFADQDNPTPDMRRALADLARIEDLPAALDDLGVMTGRSGRPEPMGELLRRAAGAVNLLVIHAIQSEPRCASHLRLLVDAAAAVSAGTRAIADFLSLRGATLLVSSSQSIPLQTLRQLRRGRVRIIPVRTGFPGDDPSILLRRLFGRNVAPGTDPLEAQCLMLPADAAWRVGAALLTGKPVVHQPVTVAGSCIEPRREGVYLLPIGLTIAGLLGWLGRRNLLVHRPQAVLLGGPLTGSTVTDIHRTAVDPTTQAVVLSSERPSLKPTACVRCGWCVNGCPAGIDPIAVLDALEALRQETPARLGVRHCIDCGVCSYVCPSHLPLAQAVKAARALADRQP